MNRTILLLLGVFAINYLSGCATKALNQEEAEEYASLDVEEFVKERFIKKKGVLSAINSGLESLSDGLYKISSDESRARADISRREREFEKQYTGLQQDGKSVIYNANYTSMNVDQLFRPIQEMTFYCKAQGGKLVSKQLYKNNFVESAFANPRDAFEDAMNTTYTGAIAVGVGPVTIAHSMNDFKNIFAEEEANRVARYNASVDRKGAVSGFMRAANAGSYGRFSCESNNSDVLWAVGIIPFHFTSQEPNNGLSTHRLKILIVPEKMQQQG